MTFRTFFLLIFLSSISSCIVLTFIPNEISAFFKNDHINNTFLALTSLITAIVSYIGLLFAHYYANKREEAQAQKQEAERVNLEIIQNELKAMA